MSGFTVQQWLVSDAVFLREMASSRDDQRTEPMVSSLGTEELLSVVLVLEAD